MNRTLMLLMMGCALFLSGCLESDAREPVVEDNHSIRVCTTII